MCCDQDSDGQKGVQKTGLALTDFNLSSNPVGPQSHSTSNQHFIGKIFMTISNSNTSLQVQWVSLGKAYM